MPKMGRRVNISTEVKGQPIVFINVFPDGTTDEEVEMAFISMLVGLELVTWEQATKLTFHLEDF